MSDFSTTIHVICSSDASQPRIINMEPWGEDYWLFPGDSVDIVVIDKDASTRISLVENDDNTQIYLERGSKNFSVLNHGQQISCGFQRARLAGQIHHAFNIKGRGVVVTSDQPWQVKWQPGDQARLLIPKHKTIRLQVRQLEPASAAGEVPENSFALFVGELEVKLEEIVAGSLLYRLV